MVKIPERARALIWESSARVYIRACLKIAFCEMCVTVCGKDVRDNLAEKDRKIQDWIWHVTHCIVKMKT